MDKRRYEIAEDAAVVTKIIAIILMVVYICLIGIRGISGTSCILAIIIFVTYLVCTIMTHLAEQELLGTILLSVIWLSNSLYNIYYVLSLN